jgi:hypothetical protein
MKLLRTIKKRFSGQPTNGRRPERHRARLAVEMLESRITPTVTLTPNGHLVVAGDDGSGGGQSHNDDQIIMFTNVAGGVVADLNGQPFGYKPGQVTSTEVDPGGGNNTVELLATPAFVPITVNCNNHSPTGSDSVVVGNGDLNALQGQITVNIGTEAALPSVQVQDQNNTGHDTYTITQSTISRPGWAGLSFSTTLLNLTLQGESGGNTYLIDGTPLIPGSIFGYFDLIGGPGINTFDVGDGNLDSIQTSVSISSTNSQDNVVVNDESASAGHAYYVAGYGGSVHVNRDDQFMDIVQASPNNSITLVGAGNDNFTVRPENGRPGRLQLFPLGGQNTLVVDDSDTIIDQCAVDQSKITQTDEAGATMEVDYNSVFQSVTVNGSHGNGGSFDVNSVAPGVAVTINPRASFGDTFVDVGNSTDGLGDIKGRLSVAATGTEPLTLTLHDHASTIGRQFVVTNQRVSFGTSQVSYSGITNLQLDGSAGGNNFAVLSTALGVTTTINAGPLGDAIEAGQGTFSTVDNCLGPLVINGQRGTTVTVADQGAHDPETYTLSTASSGETLSRSNGLVVTCNFIRSLTVNGGLGGDDFVDQAIPTSLVTTFNGGSGLNSLGATEGFGHLTGWHITGPGDGRVGTRLFFTGMHDLVGTGAFNDFEFLAGGSIAGTIAGAGGQGNTLGYGNESGPVTVDVQTGAAPQINGGAAGGFRGITNFQGSTAPANKLIGPDANTTWTISNANSGAWITGGRNFEFGRFPNLVGGSGLDVFAFTVGGSLSGTLDGGTAPLHEGNWLNYSALTTPVTVNLQTGKATGVAGAVANIQNVHGGNGGNTLTGDAQGNILIGGAGNNVITGGTGASILIGDAGAGTITGGSGGDILIGGSTVYDPMNVPDEAALMNILAEWQSSDSYATRFSDINTGTGGGLNGTARLNGTTVLKNNKVDVLTAAALPGLDWFFQGPGDILHHVEPGEHVSNI